MKEFQFKTNINCSSCVKSVKFFLDSQTKIESWKVDTNDPDKVLIASGGDLKAEDVIQVVESAGFQIETRN